MAEQSPQTPPQTRPGSPLAPPAPKRRRVLPVARNLELVFELEQYVPVLALPALDGMDEQLVPELPKNDESSSSMSCFDYE